MEEPAIKPAIHMRVMDLAFTVESPPIIRRSTKSHLSEIVSRLRFQMGIIDALFEVILAHYSYQSSSIELTCP